MTIIEDPQARLAAIRTRGRATLGARTTQELCDMYVLAVGHRNESTGDEARAACITLGWIAEVLERRDPEACQRWYAAEESIEIAMLARDEWIDGASELPPHLYFGLDQPNS
ncbi:hypothetical protein [Nonomuraea sp. NPDC023979]|uniref:hypothetical protein n=1 Tax=Nonomuraea sp. NPDC023979 TaxID=3154796 RepID=UPI0033C6C398